MKNSVVTTQLGVAGVPASGCTVRPWAAYVGGSVHGVRIAPVSAVLKQDSAVMTPAVDAASRKDANPFSTVARSGIRTEGPPV
jgi:hypothetical protein